MYCLRNFSILVTVMLLSMFNVGCDELDSYNKYTTQANLQQVHNVMMLAKLESDRYFVENNARPGSSAEAGLKLDAVDTVFIQELLFDKKTGRIKIVLNSEIDKELIGKYIQTTPKKEGVWQCQTDIPADLIGTMCQ